MNSQNKILSRAELRKRADDWRRASERITLTNGNFDLLHVGHVRYLRAAKALGGKLVVAINSDESVRALKGEGRPIMPADERAEIIAALSDVDAVLIFPELDVRAIIREIHPDIHAKGTDYTADSVPERDAVAEYGGRVEIVGDPKDHSTSDIIRSRLSPGEELIVGEEAAKDLDHPETERPEIDRLLIVRLSAMGDVIHTLPAAQALRAAFPDAEIGWLIEERWAELLCAPGAPRRGPRSAQRPLADWVHTVSLTGWRKSLFTILTLQQIAKVWNDVRAARYQVAVDLQGAIRSAVLARWSGAPVIYGAAEPRESPATLWYTRPVVTRGAHVIEQNLSIAEAVAQRTMAVPRVQFPRDLEAEQRVDRRLAEAGIGEFAILNPGGGWGAKRWPAERYGQVARALARDGLRSIFNCGPGEDDLAREAEAASEGVGMSMKCSITELIALTRRAKLFVGGDTGPLHLAAALQVPVVAIFGPTNPARNGPYGTRSIVLRSPVSPTTHARKSEPDEGMLEIGVDAVVHAARTLLAHAAAEGAHG